MMQGRSVTWCVLLGMLLVAGCDDGVDCCVDTTSGALLEGFVIDEAEQPVGGALLTSTGVRHFCGQADPLGPADGGAVADSGGWFRISLGSFLGSPGKFCVDVVVSGDAFLPDTLRDIEVEFFEGAILDTARVVLRVGR